MKKLISLLLALAMVLSLSVAAFAAVDNTPTTTVPGTPTPPVPDDGYDGRLDQAGVLSKCYAVNGGTAPAEDFTFSFTFQGYQKPGATDFDMAVTNYPTIGDVTTKFPNEITQTMYVTQEFPINGVDTAPLGVYKYKVTETPGNTAGITYNTDNMYLFVTVLRRDGDENADAKHYVAALHYSDEAGAKFGFVTNTYQAGSLKVKKIIQGNMADLADTFNFKVTFTAPEGKVVKSEITAAGGKLTEDQSITFDGATSKAFEFVLGHDDEITFTNIPAGVTYTVEETDLVDGTVTSIGTNNVYTHNDTTDENYGDTAKVIQTNETDQVTFYNHKENTNIDTGVILDNAPYIVLLAVAVIGLAIVIIKKRQAREY